MKGNLENWIFDEFMKDRLEEWIYDELRDRIFRRCRGLINYEDSTGGMIPGMYVVYAWNGTSIDQMRLGGGQVLFDNREEASRFCDLMDYQEVTENMTSRETEKHQRWTVGYIPFCSEIEVSGKTTHFSALDSRIKSGKADPISPREKELVAEIRAGYENKFGTAKKPHK